MKNIGIHHLGLVVEDLDTAAKTFGPMLGLSSLGRETLEDRGIEVEFFSANGPRIELLAPLHNKSEISGFLDKHGEGIHHICFVVEDIEEALAHLKSQGMRLIHESPQTGAHNTRVAFVHPKSCHGVLIELAEMPKTPRKEQP